MNNPLINPGIGLIFWMTLAFGILVFILIKFAWPVILKMLNEREESIDQALRAAEIARGEVKALQTGNKELLIKAEKEYDEIIQRAQETTTKIIGEAQVKANEEAGRIMSNAKSNIEYERLQAVHELKNEVASLSINIAEKLLEQELSDTEKSREFVKKEINKIQFN